MKNYLLFSRQSKSSLFLLMFLMFVGSSVQVNAQWTQLAELSSTYPGGIASNALAFHNNALYSVGTGIEGIYKSTDDGTSWQILDFANNGLPNSNSINYNDIQVVGNYIYVGQTSNTNGDIYYSTDNGATWVVDTTGLPKGVSGSGRQHVIDLWEHNGYIFVQLEVYNNYYRKLPTDASWTKMDWPSGPISFVSDGDTLFSLQGSGSAYSVDNGANWVIPANNGVSAVASAVAGLAEISGALYMGTVDWALYPNTNKGVLKSTDGGENWTLIGFTDTAPAMSHMAVNGTDTYMLATGSPSVVYQSADGGTTTTDVSGGITGSFAKMYQFNGALYACTSAGVFKMGNSTPNPNAIEEVPQKLTVSTYPNPFNTALTIENNSGALMNVELIDITGKTVITQQTAKAKITLHTENLPGGIYLLRTSDTQTGNVIATQKVIRQ